MPEMPSSLDETASPLIPIELTFSPDRNRSITGSASLREIAKN